MDGAGPDEKRKALANGVIPGTKRLPVIAGFFQADGSLPLSRRAPGEKSTISVFGRKCTRYCGSSVTKLFPAQNFAADVTRFLCYSVIGVKFQGVFFGIVME